MLLLSPEKNDTNSRCYASPFFKADSSETTVAVMSECDIIIIPPTFQTLRLRLRLLNIADVQHS